MRILESALAVVVLGCAMHPVAAAPGDEDASRIWVVRNGQPAADVYVGATEWSAAERMVRRIEAWSGAKLLMFGPSDPPASRRAMTRLLVGTTESMPVIAKLLTGRASHAALNTEGFTLLSRRDPDLILVAGRSSRTATYALGELLNYRLHVEPGNIWCEALDLSDQPALPYRWFWVSTSFNHWDEQYGGPHLTDETHTHFGAHPDGTPLCENRYPGQSLGVDAYLDTYRAMIDWMSEHKLNGAMVFGFLCNGLDAAREVARFGTDRGVDIIPGVGTMGYWGTYYGGYNEYNLDTLIKVRPEWTRTNQRKQTVVCPSMPEMADYWRRSGDWIARAMPELGGLYLEHGDFATCPCGDCADTRLKSENDSGFFWDMMASETPIIAGAAATRPEWKYVYATYTSFLPEGLKHGTARVPPRFPGQFQPFAICQWTVTGMNESNWPEGARPPAAHSLGLFHSPSIWGTPAEPDRWWAGPGSSHDDASRLVRFYCHRMSAGGFEGLIVKGMKNHHSPGPLLTYLALGEFSWHPDMSLEEWETARLPRLLGGKDLAARYLRLARDSSRDPVARQAMLNEARDVLADTMLSPRARSYWKDLAEELAYRVRLMETLSARETQPRQGSSE